MNIKESLDKLKTLLGADASDALSIISDIERQNQDRDRAMKAANKESEERRIELEEKDAVIKSKDDEIAKTLSPEAKAEIAELRKIKEAHEALLTAKAAETLASWTEKAKLLSIDKTDKRYDKVEKIKGKFIMPKEGEELTPDQIAKNIETYDLLTEAGYFAVETQKPGGAPPANNADVPKTGSTLGYVQSIPKTQ